MNSERVNSIYIFLLCLNGMDAETGFEPVSSGYEPDKVTTPLLCNIRLSMPAESQFQ